MMLKTLKATWCSSCKMMKTTWEAIQRDYPKLDLNYVDCSNDEEIAESYGVSMLPAMVVVDENNNFVDKLEGSMHRDLVEEFLRKNNLI